MGRTDANKMTLAHTSTLRRAGRLFCVLGPGRDGASMLTLLDHTDP